MTSERSDLNNNPTVDAGANPQDIPGHLSDVPYDNTPLSEAVESNLGSTEIDPEQLKALQEGNYWSDRPPARELPVTSKTKESFLHKHGKKFAAGALALGVLGGSAKALMDSNAETVVEPTSTSQPSNTVEAVEPTATPSPEVSPSSIAVVTEQPVVTPSPEVVTKKSKTGAFEMDANQEPEALVKDYLTLITNWANAGCTQSTVDNFDTTIPADEYYHKIAVEQSEQYAVALYGPDYRSNPDAVRYVENGIKTNETTLKIYVGTMLSVPELGGYNQQQVFDKIDSVTPITSDISHIVFESHFENNSHKFPRWVQTPNGEVTKHEINFKQNGDVMYIKDGVSTQP